MTSSTLPAYDHLVKLLLIGNSGVGKTSLLLRYVDDTFSTTFITTIAIDFRIKFIETRGKRIQLTICHALPHSHHIFPTATPLLAPTTFSTQPHPSSLHPTATPFPTPPLNLPLMVYKYVGIVNRVYLADVRVYVPEIATRAALIYLADVRVFVPEIATRAALIYLAGVRVYVPEIATRAALIYLADVRVYVPEIATRAALIYLAGVRVYVPEIAT
ncbi:hypothetical protein EMCRGX_G034362 [Ephydatia muelleri]